MSETYIKTQIIHIISALARVPELPEMSQRASTIMHVIRDLIHVLYVVYNDYPTSNSKLDCIEDMRDDVDEMLTRIYNMR